MALKRQRCGKVACLDDAAFDWAAWCLGEITKAPTHYVGKLCGEFVEMVAPNCPLYTGDRGKSVDWLADVDIGDDSTGIKVGGFAMNYVHSQIILIVGIGTMNLPPASR